MATAEAPLRVGVGEHLQLTSAHHLAVATHQQRQQRGAAVPTTGDVEHPSLDSLLARRKHRTRHRQQSSEFRGASNGHDSSQGGLPIQLRAHTFQLSLERL